jgi:CYTH domain-containing protein
VGGVEIERKFLLTSLPDAVRAVPGDRVEQGYLAIGSDGVEVRVRRRAGTCTLTVKSGPGGTSRVEEELALEAAQFASLWELSGGRRVEKTRHVVPLDGGACAEVDVYAGALAGLLTAEVEFPSEDASRAFAPPDWFGAEVTGDARYANQSLALHGAP